MDTSITKPQNIPLKKGRNHSASITNKVNGGLKTLSKSVSCVSKSPPAHLIKNTLSPISSTVSASLDTLTKITPSKSLKRRSQQSTISNPQEVDIAQPKNNMAKSFVSLLTTASLYNGNLQDIIAENSVELEDGVEGTETFVAETDTTTLPPNLPRRPTLFEISTETKQSPTEEQCSPDSPSSKNCLSEQLKKSFKITEDDELIANYRCWLMKDVLLQGHMYITTKYLMFLAFLPKADSDKVALSGALAIDSIIRTPKKSSRYWAVLKKSSFSLYNSSSDLYFPILTIDLRYALRAEIIHNDSTDDTTKGTWFKIITESRNYRFFADSEHSARAWVSLLKKHIFTSRNDGDCVTVKIPIQNIIDIEEAPIFDAAETLKLKVLESPELYAIDDYYFMFFNSGPEIAKILSSAVKNLVDPEIGPRYDSVLDSTSNILVDEKQLAATNLKNALYPPEEEPKSPATTDTSTSSNLTGQYVGISSSQLHEEVVEQYISRDLETNDQIEEIAKSSPQSPPHTAVTSDLTSYLPGYSLTTKSIAHAKTTLGKWTPKVLKSASSMWTANPVHYAERNSLERGSEDEFLATPEERNLITTRFQHHFSLSESNILISTYYAYLQRNVPAYGKIYLGSNEICFRSLVPGFNIKMILPYKDIENCYKEKGFKFGYSGLVIVIHGHEELFFEFGSSVARDDCEFVLLKQLDDKREEDSIPLSPLIDATLSPNAAINSDQISTNSKLEAAKIKLFEDKIHEKAGLNVPIIIEDHPLFDTSIKPKRSYKISLLTIGSRGDVQPYIALGKGLIKEGHEVTIITHKEFEEWILKHNLGFKEIAGNPTELMSLMVSHGSMNVGLLKEASGKFRGWITELLKTSWEACQGTEILIESPSAMAGIHIAEALGIPYFRAFTMPWTRTRAYPHAFIVPDQKQGGSYNYLTHVLFENIFWKGISGQVNKWRKESLNLPKTNLDLLQQNKVPFLYNVSPMVMAPPVDYSDWIKVTGYWFLDEAIDYDPPKELIEFISKAKEDGKKLVYIGFGSIVVSNPKELTEAVVEAVLQADVRCILNKGWSERLGGPNKVEVELPYEVFNAGSLPHDWLFPQIDAAVHHGGSGTTGATLRAGLPTIIKPFFGDQFFYANRVEDIGVGIGLKKLNVKSLTKALKEATTNQRMISKAKIVGEKISRENGVSNAISIIYHELEYAKELILNKRTKSLTPEQERSIDLSDKRTQILANLTGLDRSILDEDYEDDDLMDNEGSWLLV